MARKRPNIGAALTLDGEREFKAALAEINAGLKVNASQMQLVAATYEDGGKSAKDLAAAQDWWPLPMRMAGKAPKTWRPPKKC